MPLVIRPFTNEDAEMFLNVHHAAVRETAIADYPAPVIDAWAPKIEAAHIQSVRADRTGIKIIAESSREIVGIGEIAPGVGELRACYVAPRHGRMGVGRAIVTELEKIARSHGMPSLWLDSSLTAEAFYKAFGYVPLKRGQHTLRTGIKMACVKMSKEL